ncbi:hypothetical protein COHA_001649 [Chlorella ohadii]|uniref:Radical SAM core domain-containing protein n=1 Tax=Chlorella ohadii TaxID=2649997 RepID=A0AAD5DW71_9CHLO|nr:hypothetical protein COHA_001649 [Chlorella ohadii]
MWAASSASRAAPAAAAQTSSRRTQHTNAATSWRPSRRLSTAARPTGALGPAAAAAAPAATDAPPARHQQHAQAQAGGRPQGELRFPYSYYDGEGRLVLKNLTLPQLEAWCASIGEDGPKRALQLWRFMYYDCKWIRSLEDAAVDKGVQSGFSRAFREKCAGLATIDGGLLLQSIHSAADGTRKMVFKVAHGPAAGGQVETVLIPISREAGAKARITLCVSSQVGCDMGCQFCYTGRMGLMGNLTPGQIVEQVVAARRLLWEEDVAAGVQRHITPITARDGLLTTRNHSLGLHVSYNKITVSTVGLVPEMRQFAAESRAVMAVSLHATTDEVRDRIVPVNKRWPLAELIATMEELFPKDKAAPRHGHHVLVAYTMLQDVNDTDEDARRLLELVKNIRCKVNLIVYNEYPGTPFRPSTPERVQAFRSILIQGGHVATVRDSRGDDQMAACGQLGDPGLSSRPRPARPEAAAAVAAA